MNILVINSGSSSVKYQLFDMQQSRVLTSGLVERIGEAESRLLHRWLQDGDMQELVRSETIADHQHAFEAIGAAMRDSGSLADVARLDGIGHRVVHGGSTRDAPALITPALLEELDALSPLAPHHQPHNLAAIRAVADAAPQLPQVACFDTAFHAVQPTVARRLPLPARYRDKGLQRYGFHGLSYEYITAALAGYHAGQLPARLIVAHLCNGASLCAIRDGKSIASSMGFSTLDGLLMGSRCGTLDPGVLLHLLREERMDERALSDLLYNHSGLLGVSGISSDMQVLLNSDAPAAAEAVDLFCYTLVRAIGSMTAALGGVDALVFTGGIGEHAAAVRARVCGELAWLGLAFDAQSNERGVDLLTRADSRVKVWVIPTNEELVIARHTRSLVSGARDLQPNSVKSDRLPGN